MSKNSFVPILIFVLILISQAIALSCGRNVASDLHIASLMRLIVLPEKYDGARVSVKGVLGIELEGDRICNSEDDYRNYVSTNCVYLNLSDEEAAAYRHLAGKYVFLVGTFGMVGSSSSRQYYGVFEQVESILPSPEVIPPVQQDLEE